MSEPQQPDELASQLPLEPADEASEPAVATVPHGLVEPPDLDDAEPALVPESRPAIPSYWRDAGVPLVLPADGSPETRDDEPELPGEPEPEPADEAVSGPDLRRRWPLVPEAAVVLTVLVTLVFLMFLLTEPTQRWIVLLGVAAAALGADGLLRSARSEAFELGLDTTPQLFLPTLYALAIPVFVEHNARGFWVPISGLAAGLGFGAVLLAEVHSVREYEPGFAPARAVAGGAAYLTAFALLSLSYTFELDLAPAIVAAALVGGLLSVEVLRDAVLDPLDTLTFAAVAALVVGELRWALHFVPLDGHLAALALVLGLFFTSGVLYSHLHRQLTRSVLAEYVGVAAAGVLLVVAARAADLA